MVPTYAVEELLRLGMGPWVFNIMGLFVVLTLAVPALIWLMQRRLWWLVLIASWALYITDALLHVRVIDSQFQDVFPLLTWQVVFTHGIVLGYYRKQIVRVLYGDLFNRTFLQPGRLMELLLFLSVAFIVLTAFWNPLSKAFGWLYILLGKASLYVVIVHVFFVLAVGNVPGLDRTGTWQGLLAPHGGRRPDLGHGPQENPLQSHSPLTASRPGEPAALSPSGTAADVDAAVTDAAAAQPAWAALPAPSRGAILMAAGNLLLWRQTAIAEDLVREEGKTLAEAKGEVKRASDVLRFFGSLGGATTTRSSTNTPPT